MKANYSSHYPKEKKSIMALKHLWWYMSKVVEKVPQVFLNTGAMMLLK